MSTGGCARTMRVRPPVTKSERKPRAKSIALVKRILARQSVASQLKVLIAEGTAMTSVVVMKAVQRGGCMPLVYMWCPQTRKERKAMATIEPTMKRYPKMGLRALLARVAEIMPMGGRMRT